ncbi:GDP-mannose 4,6-dehydratase [Paenibacillus sp. SC116]|uniref:NAD-dependent epimerase/dehydratase family protein n=1 Tax=Paenibacillus sp. SC116 TaxID=2968986 RepID=UPI00215A75CE|nr:NAD-dependent epimerase/dehydratase family protein [Paenibacillus sp. SC116]MCR8846187.1 GDP-mannose 4,6-dehydratase [Paenibacillus sp. SC116]
MMRIIVTGGAGFIGSHVVEDLISNGHEVHVLDNFSTGSRSWIHPSAITHDGDIRRRAVVSLIQSLQPDVVVHLAAQADVKKSQEDPYDDLDVNASGTIRLLQACASLSNTHFIFASTSAVYGDQSHTTISESDSLHPSSCYGLSKWTAEQYIRLFSQQHELHTSILRFANVYGPRQTPKGEGGVIALFTDRILHDKPILIHGDGEQTRDFIYVKDVSSAIQSVAAHRLYDTFNVSTGKSVSINELSLIYEQLSGKSIQRQRGMKRIGDIRHSCLSADKLQHHSSWRPSYSLHQGLELTWQYAAAALPSG